MGIWLEIADRNRRSDSDLRPKGTETHLLYALLVETVMQEIENAINRWSDVFSGDIEVYERKCELWKNRREGRDDGRNKAPARPAMPQWGTWVPLWR